MYFHTDNPRDLNWLAAVVEEAADNGRRLRLDVNDSGYLTVKVGESAWSAPIAGTADPYRDKSFANVVPAKNYSEGMTFVEVVKDLINMDALGSTEPLIRHFYNKVIQEGIDHA